MTSANSLILGLGLFFLGLRLIGENLRRLYGSSTDTGSQLHHRGCIGPESLENAPRRRHSLAILVEA